MLRRRFTGVLDYRCWRRVRRRWPATLGALATAALLFAGPASASNWLTGGSGQGESTSTGVSETVNSTCTATATGTSCGTANLLPNAGSSSTQTVKNSGVPPTNETLTATSCSAGTVTDTNAASTPTVAHGNFTSSSYQASGPLSGKSVSFDGSTTWFGTGGGAVDGPQNFTLLGWFKTSASSPGPILNFADGQSPSSTNHHDRSLWIDASGDLVAGVAPAANLQEAVGTTAVNDGNWHLAAVTDSSSSGLTLYLDGSSQATNSSGAGAQSYAGWWSVGGGKLAGWSNTPTLNGAGAAYFNGSLAGVAVIPSVLTGAQISTLHSEASYSAYATAVAAYSPSHYWGLQDTAPTPSTGTTATLPGQVTQAFPDLSSNANTATPMGGVSTSASGPLSSGGSATFDGSSGYLETASSAAAPQTYTQLVWFKTSGASTQIVLWMGDHQDPLAAAAQDRFVFVNSSGNVEAYAYNGSGNFISSTSTYNDGNWHMAAVTLSSAGFYLYVDGSLQASNASVTSAETYSAPYWAIGVGSNSSWYFKGSLAGAAILPTALSAAAISSLYSSSSFSAYTTTVLADSPSYYWPLTNETTTYPDVSGTAENVISTGTVTNLTSGPLSGSGAVTFDGDTGYLELGSSITAPTTYTQMVWFKTSSSTGGLIFGFANNATPGSANSYDHLLWVDNTGHLVAGQWVSNNSYEVSTASTVNNGAWHLATITDSPSGLSLYLDGSLVGTNTTAVAASYSGWWYLGGGKIGIWSDPPTENGSGVSYFSGSLAGAAIVPTALSAAQISGLYSSASFSTYSGSVINDLPSQYWPLSSPVNACSAAVATVAMSISGTTTCLLPAEASGTACPAVGTGGLPLVDVTTAQVNSAVSLAAGTSSTWTINIADNGTLPGPLSGVDVLTDATVAAQLNNWQAGAVYSSSRTQL